MIKLKTVILGVTLVASLVSNVAATPEGVKKVFSTNPVALEQTAQQLRLKLASIEAFSAQFSQEVFDNKHQLIAQATGSVKVAQPNQFHWLTNEPDESLIVSDGRSVWVYNPFVEQVSIMSLDKTVRQSPLWLIANQTDEAWSQFQVSNEQGVYTIKPKDPQSLTKQIEMTFTGDALSRLSLLDSQGQSSVFVFAEFNSAPSFSRDIFTFVAPVGVDIDDQRTMQ